MFKLAIEWALIATTILLLISQIMVPTIFAIFGKDLPFFWIFGSKKLGPSAPKEGVEKIVDELKQSAAQHKASEMKADAAIDALKKAKGE